MNSVRIILSGLWVATMLTYLLGDVIRLFSGDTTPGEIDGQPATQWMWMAAAMLMLVPIVMVVLSLIVPFPAIRWVTLGAVGFTIVFNVVALPYQSAYDNFLIAVSFVFNGMVVWYAWTWV